MRPKDKHLQGSGAERTASGSLDLLSSHMEGRAGWSVPTHMALHSLNPNSLEPPWNLRHSVSAGDRTVNTDALPVAMEGWDPTLTQKESEVTGQGDPQTE